MTVSVNDAIPEEETKAGSYFVSNYPPYGEWSVDRATEALAAFERPRDQIHIEAFGWISLDKCHRIVVGGHLAGDPAIGKSHGVEMPA